MSSIPISLQNKPVDFRDPFYFRELISKWVPPKQVYPFSHGDDVLSVSVCATAAYATHFFRRTFKLRQHARLSIYTPTVFLTAMSSSLFNELVVTKKIINQKECRICIKMQAAVGQFLVSTLFPIITSGIACTYFADRILTYPVPSLIEAPKEVFQLWWKLVNGNRRVFLLHGAFQMILCLAITHAKQTCFVELEEACFKKKKLYF